jgi:UDP-N-acetylglucosamine:LPS N-acetylglucosamine transferase
VYPALTTYQVVKASLGDSLETLWIGGEGGLEVDMVERLSVPFKTIPAAGVHGVGLRSLPGNVTRLARGYSRSRQLLKEFNPDVLFFTGGYLGVPVALAGLSRRKVLYVPDIEPALALKALAYTADQIALTVPDSMEFFPEAWRNRLVVTGYPVRQEFTAVSREAARKQLSLDQSLPVLLVSGGSRGARSINRALISGLQAFLGDMQVVHITGQLDWQECRELFGQLSGQAAGYVPWERYHALPYLHEMGLALASADLVLSRAGASVLGEYPYFGLPAILVPYPYAWKYQQVNAEWLKKLGAAVVLDDEKLQDELVATVRGLMTDKKRLSDMREASRRISKPDAANKIAEILMQYDPCQNRRAPC